MITLCRHGDTEWSPSRRLAGRTDLPLTTAGEATATSLGPRLSGVVFDRVWTSPLGRARRTAELAGYPAALHDDRLVEMDFGAYEGRMTQDIRVERPGWAYLADGCPGGESPDDVARRADAVLADLRALGGATLVFGHSVFSRVLAARYLGLPPAAGRGFLLSPGAISVLDVDPIDGSPAIASWNRTA